MIIIVAVRRIEESCSSASLNPGLDRIVVPTSEHNRAMKFWPHARIS